MLVFTDLNVCLDSILKDKLVNLPRVWTDMIDLAGMLTADQKIHSMRVLYK